MPTALMPEGRQRYFNNDGTPCAGGKLWTYAAGTSNPKATYADEAGTVLNQNPVPLDAKGEALIFWSGAYKVDLKQADGTQVTGYPVDNLKTDPAGIWGILGTVLAQLAQAAGASLVGFIQAGAGAIQRTLQAKNREIISVADYGAKGDGVTDDTAAIQAAANAAAGKALYFPGVAASYKISTAINLANSTRVYGDGKGSVVKQASGDMSAFMVSNKSGVTVENLVILCEVAGTVAYNGGVYLLGASKCTVRNVEFVGLTWGGVLLQNSSQNTVTGCTFRDWLGTIQDSADVMIYQNSNYNVISGNQCHGRGNHGIMVFDPYTNSTPTGNVITGNVVTQHTAYGIVVYIALATTVPYDSRNVIANNVISDILGSGIAGTSGAGIYIQAGNGVIVTGNKVNNCCRQTTNFDTLAMAGIAVQLGETTTGAEVEALVSNNHVYASRGPCFFAAASNRTIHVSGNVFKSDSTDGVRGEAVNIINCNAIQFNNNSIRHQNPNFAAFKLVAVDTEYSNHQIANNVLCATHSGGGFLVTTSGAGVINHVQFTGNLVFGDMANIIFNFIKVNGLNFANNQGDSSGIVFNMQNCPKARLSANRLYSSSAGYSIIFAGVNTGSLADESNDFSGSVENDAGNGTTVAMYASAVPPMSGLWNVGDVAINRAPAVGTPERWRCTVAGYPGTWSPVNL